MLENTLSHANYFILKIFVIFMLQECNEVHFQIFEQLFAIVQISFCFLHLIGTNKILTLFVELENTLSPLSCKGFYNTIWFSCFLTPYMETMCFPILQIM